MSRVVPSQIVVLIDRILSGMPASAGPHARNLSTSQAPEISAVIDLISELPDEFLVLSGDEYSHYRVDINTLRDLLSLWKSSQPVGIINRQAEKTIQSLNRLQRLLTKCPDETPSPSTAALAFIHDADLRDSIRNDISAANRALHDGLWKAATVLAGGATEALLLWAIAEKKSTSDIENARIAVAPLAKDPNSWGLDGYIKVARHLALIEDETVNAG